MLTAFIHRKFPVRTRKGDKAAQAIRIEAADFAAFQAEVAEYAAVLTYGTVKSIDVYDAAAWAADALTAPKLYSFGSFAGVAASEDPADEPAEYGGRSLTAMDQF